MQPIRLNLPARYFASEYSIAARKFSFSAMTVRSVSSFIIASDLLIALSCAAWSLRAELSPTILFDALVLVDSLGRTCQRRIPQQSKRPPRGIPEASLGGLLQSYFVSFRSLTEPHKFF